MTVKNTAGDNPPTAIKNRLKSSQPQPEVYKQQTKTTATMHFQVFRALIQSIYFTPNALAFFP